MSSLERNLFYLHNKCDAVNVRVTRSKVDNNLIEPHRVNLSRATFSTSLSPNYHVDCRRDFCRRNQNKPVKHVLRRSLLERGSKLRLTFSFFTKLGENISVSSETSREAHRKKFSSGEGVSVGADKTLNLKVISMLFGKFVTKV